MDAGLPNIEGIFTGGGANDKERTYPQGAFYWKPGGFLNDMHNYNSNAVTYTPLVFSAARSNSIYGNSNTVQPPSLTMLYIIKSM